MSKIIVNKISEFKTEEIKDLVTQSILIKNKEFVNNCVFIRHDNFIPLVLPEMQFGKELLYSVEVDFVSSNTLQKSFPISLTFLRNEYCANALYCIQSLVFFLKEKSINLTNFSLHKEESDCLVIDLFFEQELIEIQNNDKASWNNLFKVHFGSDDNVDLQTITPDNWAYYLQKDEKIVLATQLGLDGVDISLNHIKTRDNFFIYYVFGLMIRKDKELNIQIVKDQISNLKKINYGRNRFLYKKENNLILRAENWI